MKYKTMMEKFYSMNLQLFADDPAPNDDGDGGDDPESRSVSGNILRG